jgi:hypothetical protein
MLYWISSSRSDFALHRERSEPNRPGYPHKPDEISAPTSDIMSQATHSGKVSLPVEVRARKVVGKNEAFYPGKRRVLHNNLDPFSERQHTEADAAKVTLCMVSLQPHLSRLRSSGTGAKMRDASYLPNRYLKRAETW